MHCKCIFHRCKEACNVLKSGWSITSIFHHWSRTKFIRLWWLVRYDWSRPAVGCFSNDFTGNTWPGTSYEAAHVSGWVAAPAARKLHCTVQAVSMWRLNAGLLVKYPGLSWALSLWLTDKHKALFRRDYRRQAAAWCSVCLLQQSSALSPGGAHTFAAEQDCVNYMSTKCHNPRHTGHFNNAWRHMIQFAVINVLVAGGEV